MRRLFLAAALATVIVGQVQAAPCAGFTDVEETSGFCPNVTWIKNRGITLGCATTVGNQSGPHYCPNDPVSRLSMAAFLHRVGTALLPIIRGATQSIPPTDLTSGARLCVTQDVAIDGHERKARVDATINFVASHPDAALVLFPQMSFDGGTSWSPASLFLDKAYSSINIPGTGHSAGTGAVMSSENLLTVGTTVRFALLVDRDTSLPGQAANLISGSCVLRAHVTTTSSPL